MESAFFGKEITCIPQVLNKHFGKNFNFLVNALTWMVLLWFLLHALYDRFLSAFFRRLRYKQHVRLQLQTSLWYLGFYTTALAFYLLMLHENGSCGATNLAACEGLIPAFIITASFFLHSSIWELLSQNGVIGLKYLVLSGLVVEAYISQVLGLMYRILVSVCLMQAVLELTRCAFSCRINKTTSKVLFISSIVTFFFNVVWVYLVAQSRVQSVSPSFQILSVALLSLWLLLELLFSVVLKLYLHLRIHGDSCDLDTFECSLFPARNDATFELLAFKEHMAARERKRKSGIRPAKGKRVMFQTVKCMVALKRKLGERRMRNEKKVTFETETLDADASDSKMHND